ncbi:adenylate kinase [Peptoniphilus catoniae]|uniref:adenylate kinase n=1 Tax=Peptoniphilus catoniae TaxID=1660341 RepID=UPI0010FF53DC|nr:adenylate kinase [Peptoniphilus catoniae]
MKLVILGPPGAGKGTQAEFIINKYNIPHISTGDIFRENIKNQTELGKKAKSYMDKGLLVPDELVIKIVQERISRDDCKDGFLLDGFPRTVAQAVSLDAQLDKLETKLDKVINIDVDSEILVDRAVGRRICKTCGATYHIKYNPPKVEGVCDKDNTALIQRDDDVKETVEKRISVYLNQTVPLLDYYTAQGLLINIDGSRDIKKVSEDIVKGLEK